MEREGKVDRLIIDERYSDDLCVCSARDTILSA